MTQKDTLRTNSVNFINEAKKSLLLSPAQWQTLSVIIPLTFKTSWLFVFFP